MRSTPTDDFEGAIRAGAARALRSRAAFQRQASINGTAPAGEKFPHVMIRTGEATIAARLADAFEQLAAEIETEASQ